MNPVENLTVTIILLNLAKAATEKEMPKEVQGMLSLILSFFTEGPSLIQLLGIEKVALAKFCIATIFS